MIEFRTRSEINSVTIASTSTSTIANRAGASGPRVVIEAGAVVGARTGVGQAAAALLDGLKEVWPAAWPKGTVWINSPRLDLPDRDAWFQSGKFRIKHSKWSGKAMLRGWQYLDMPRVETVTGLNGIDLVHGTSGYVPAVGPGVKRVVTVYDCYHEHHPEHGTAYGGKYFKATYGRRLELADAVICISDFTRYEVLRFYRLPEEKVRMVRLGVDHARFNAVEKEDDAGTVEALGIGGEYFLCVATLEPRKNLRRLLEAYGRVADRLGETPPALVLCGDAGWGSENIGEIVARLGLSGKVKITGYVEDAKLPALYRRASGFVFPPMYEGFGMPVLEAMACGTPCALSRIAALKEVAGEAAIYFDPGDVEGMAAAMVELAKDVGARERLRGEGMARAKAFSWETTARETVAIYREV